MEQYDVVVVGGGPGGMTAAIYAARQGHKVVVLERAACGGLMLQTERIENYPGFEAISGEELAKRMKTQAISNGAVVKELCNVEKVGEEVVIAGGEKYHYKYLLLAMGTVPRKLGVTGEQRLLGSGVSYCAVCDGFFFKDRVVGVVGGGNSALTEALYLSKITKKVFLIYHGKHFKAEQSLIKKVEESSTIVPILGCDVEKIIGDKKVEAVELSDGQKLCLDGVFISIGHVPNTSLVEDFVALDKKGFIIVDQNMRTSRSNVFACGDVTNWPIKQITTACAQGTIAAINMR